MDAPDQHIAHFVLDQNFPWLAIGLPWPLHIRLTPLASIEPDLVAEHDDWEILYRLGQREDVDGFITNDENMLDLPREMVVMQHALLVLVITRGVGHNPIRATGLLMASLEEIAKRVHIQPQVYVVKPSPLTPLNLAKQINKLAQRESLPPPDLIRRERAAVEDVLRQQRPD